MVGVRMGYGWGRDHSHKLSTYVEDIYLTSHKLSTYSSRQVDHLSNVLIKIIKKEKRNYSNLYVFFWLW